MNFNIDLTNTPICHIHNFIQDECIEIMSAIQESPIKDTIKEEIIEQRLAKILYMCKKAEEQGQKMENRLKEYRNAIESLGFKRVKNNLDMYTELIPDPYEVYNNILNTENLSKDVFNKLDETIKDCGYLINKLEDKKVEFANDNQLCPICGEQMKAVIYEESREYQGFPCSEEFIDFECPEHGIQGRDF